MSRAFIESFFPSLIAQIRSSNQIRPIYEFLLPQDVMQSCPEVVLRVRMDPGIASIWNDALPLEIRNPVLLMTSVIGASFGLYVGLFHNRCGFMALLFPRKAECLIAESFWWSISFLFFGGMNLAAIPLHSFVLVYKNQQRLLLPQQYPFLWIMDNYCTGVFSLALTLWLYDCRSNQVSSNGRRNWTCLLILLLIGCVPITRFLLSGSTLELELWYLIPVGLCASYFAFDLFFALPRMNASFPRYPVVHSMIYVAMLLLLVGGLFLDAPLCRWSTRHLSLAEQNAPSIPWFWDAVRLPTIAFVACDAAFFGLYLQQRESLVQSMVETKIHSE